MNWLDITALCLFCLGILMMLVAFWPKTKGDKS